MFAKVILNLTAKELDRPFTYRVPFFMEKNIKIGSLVRVPFGSGNAKREGYVLSLVEDCDFDESRCKEISEIPEKSFSLEARSIELAVWMRNRFGGTLSQCLSITRVQKENVKALTRKNVVLRGSKEELASEIEKAEKGNQKARIRLLKALAENECIPFRMVREELRISAPTLKKYTDSQLIVIEEERSLDGLDKEEIEKAKALPKYLLNEEQQKAVDSILQSENREHLLFGVTGSGKTEVYLSLIEKTIRDGKSAIVLIPEISLTYQNLMRFYRRFPGIVSTIHSRLSEGEKTVRYLEAKAGKIKIMIGPRSALFTPFQNIGLILVDEFHDGSYQSDFVPKYDALETARKLAETENAKIVFGSATPRADYYYQAEKGILELHALTNRASENSRLPEIQVVDMREELKAKNRSVFSRELHNRIEEALKNQKQVMLFLNRRGYSGACSCRSCGEMITCPHCSVALSYHKNNTLVCHFCGYETKIVKECPKCGSHAIGTFGIGTEKIEELTKEEFPNARILRMDADTTKEKNSHKEILEAFRDAKADILIGTQMIVKGHDFPNVTVVGILAADLSLSLPSYKSAEITYQLLVQAVGRAGRRDEKGTAIIQTYQPEHYAVTAAKKQDYALFYSQEMVFRRALKYPPFGEFTEIKISGQEEKRTAEVARRLVAFLKEKADAANIKILGPVDANPHKTKDQYHNVCYLKGDSLKKILAVKNLAEDWFRKNKGKEKVILSVGNGG